MPALSGNGQGPWLGKRDKPGTERGIFLDSKVTQLLERIRGTASAAADTASDTARVAGRKAGQMVDIAKLNVQIFELNNTFDELLRKMGQVMYDTHCGRTSALDVPDLLARADETADKIADVRERVAVLRQSKNCPGCGSTCAREDKFCRSCGRTL